MYFRVNPVIVYWLVSRQQFELLHKYDRLEYTKRTIYMSYLNGTGTLKTLLHLQHFLSGAQVNRHAHFRTFDSFGINAEEPVQLGIVRRVFFVINVSGQSSWPQF